MLQCLLLVLPLAPHLTPHLTICDFFFVSEGYVVPKFPGTNTVSYCTNTDMPTPTPSHLPPMTVVLATVQKLC